MTGDLLSAIGTVLLVGVGLCVLLAWGLMVVGAYLTARSRR